MAYATGTANSLADLLAAIQNTCTANGWTLSGNVLHKGTCYVELMISGSIITIRGGTGIDGSNNLTGATDQPSGQLGLVINSFAFTFPMIYHVFIGTVPDEVYAVVNYSGIKYQQIAWGQSAMPGLTGTGNWYNGCIQYSASMPYPGPAANGDAGSTYEQITSILCRSNNAIGPKAFGVDHRLDSATWLIDGAARDWSAMFWRLPNIWNSETILIPIRAYANRPSGFFSPVLECAHARYTNCANISDGDVITLGTDKWKVFPWWDRVLSKYAAHAFRYDGP